MTFRQHYRIVHIDPGKISSNVQTEQGAYYYKFLRLNVVYIKCIVNILYYIHGQLGFTIEQLIRSHQVIIISD